MLAPDSAHSGHVEIRRCSDHQRVLEVPLGSPTITDNWQIGYSYEFDFSALTNICEYYASYNETHSHHFAISQRLLYQHTFSDVIHYFKSQRCGGIYDEADRRATIFGSEEIRDVQGGWYDASGDVSKYLSHLSYANYLNPQQIPLVVWSLQHSLQILREAQIAPQYTQTRLIEEAKHGADFLLKMQHQSGFFYMTVFDKWTKVPQQRELCAYQTQQGYKGSDYEAGFRQGGGMSIAALAAVGREPLIEASIRTAYIEAAQKGYWHLKKHNLNYLDDGQQNIIDEYCALVACCELYRTTTQQTFLDEARAWAKQLMLRQHSDANYCGFWSANAQRPYFHASDAGLPVIALSQYVQLETDPKQAELATHTIEQAITFELNISHEVANSFAYPRQYVKDLDSSKRSAFFIAQNNESGYWWQGENARLASLACMGYMVSNQVKAELKVDLQHYSQSCLDWILGCNPYDMCMLDGHGHNNPDYLPELGFFNAKGGICNGITAGFNDPHDIAFNPQPQADDMEQNWRWAEQWIPHATWYLLAIALQAKQESL